MSMATSSMVSFPPEMGVVDFSKSLITSLEVEMERLQEEKMATETALKAALARKREALIASATGGRGLEAALGTVPSSTNGSSGSFARPSGPLTGASKAAWEKAVVEDELSQPLKISPDMLLRLTEEEREAERRLQSELAVHMSQLKQLRTRILEREGSAGPAHLGSALGTRGSAGGGPGSVRFAPMASLSGGGSIALSGMPSHQGSSMLSGGPSISGGSAAAAGAANLGRLEALERRIAQLEAGLAGKAPLVLSAPGSRSGTATGGHPGHARDAGLGGSGGGGGGAGPMGVYFDHGDGGTGSAATPTPHGQHRHSGTGGTGKHHGPGAGSASFASLSGPDVPLSVALLGGGGGGGGLAAPMPRLPPSVTSAIAPSDRSGKTLPALASAPVLGLVFKREKVKGAPGQPAQMQYAVMRAPGGGGFGAGAGGSGAGMNLPEYRGSRDAGGPDGDDAMYDFSGRDRGTDRSRGGGGGTGDEEDGGGANPSTNDAIEQWLEAKTREAQLREQRAAAPISGRAGSRGGAPGRTGPSPYAPAGISAALRANSQPPRGAAGARAPTAGSSSAGQLSRSAGPPLQRGGAGSASAGAGLGSSGAFRPVGNRAGESAGGSGTGSGSGAAGGKGGVGLSAAGMLPMSDVIGRQRMAAAAKSGGAAGSRLAATRGSIGGASGAAATPAASAARAGARTAIGKATLAQFTNIRSNFESAKVAARAPPRTVPGGGPPPAGAGAGAGAGASSAGVGGRPGFGARGGSRGPQTGASGVPARSPGAGLGSSTGGGFGTGSARGRQPFRAGQVASPAGRAGASRSPLQASGGGGGFAGGLSVSATRKPVAGSAAGAAAGGAAMRGSSTGPGGRAFGPGRAGGPGAGAGASGLRPQMSPIRSGGPAGGSNGGRGSSGPAAAAASAAAGRSGLAGRAAAQGGAARGVSQSKSAPQLLPRIAAPAGAQRQPVYAAAGGATGMGMGVQGRTGSLPALTGPGMRR